MNYLAHGFRFLEHPEILVGTAVPDMLSACDRRARLRTPHVAPWRWDADPRQAALAQGLWQHFQDDAWFHAHPTFFELQCRFAVTIAQRLEGDASHRPSFLGHILVELLLDANYMQRFPGLVERYYDSIGSIDPDWLQAAINRMARQQTDRLADFFTLFLRERFLVDYQTDAGLLRRLNQVMLRVGLETLPENFSEFLAAARLEVAARADDWIDHTTAMA